VFRLLSETAAPRYRGAFEPLSLIDSAFHGSRRRRCRNAWRSDNAAMGTAHSVHLITGKQQTPKPEISRT
jgi:hypothetical protein